MGVLTGKTALVTGGSRGIGREIALRLAGDGAFVLVHYGSNADAAAMVVAEIEGAGGTARAVGADLSDFDSIVPLFGEVDAALDGRPLDIVVNNAGIGVVGDLMAVTQADFDRVFAINVKAPLFVAQEAAKRMQAGGRIVNISSMVGSQAFGGAYIAYGATKAAVDYLTIAMAASLGSKGITVNAVAPGATATDFIADMLADPAVTEATKAQAALGDIGHPRDIANAVAFLASPDGRWVTGESIRVSGGTAL